MPWETKGVQKMAVFRVERTQGYTVMSNYHLRDKSLSLKAKGLLSQMLSLPEDWDYTLSGLAVINRESKRLSHSLKQAEKQLKQYNDASDSLYLDWKSGEITKEEYRRLKGKIAEQIQQLEANISYLKEEMQVMADGIGTDDPYLTAFLKYKNIQSLNRGIMVELVKAVWVHENGEITVDFNFADEYQRIIDYIENNHNVIRVIENKAI